MENTGRPGPADRRRRPNPLRNGWGTSHRTLSPLAEAGYADGSVIDDGNLVLSDAFSSPEETSKNGDIDPILRGLAHGTVQEPEPHVVEAVRSFLFDETGSDGLDQAVRTQKVGDRDCRT